MQLDTSAAPGPAPLLLRAHEVGRVYGQGALTTRVLHPSTLDVRSGEVVVLVGPSGSGKTTLLSILGLVLTPSEGEVWLAGECVSKKAHGEVARVRLGSIGFVFQQFNLLQGLSALENVEVPLVLDRMSAKERHRKALTALERVGLSDHVHARPRELSGGQQQRVAIARAIVGRPSVILCDEPTASLDGESGKRVLDLLRSLVDEGGRAAVIVTHDERVLRIADRIIEVADGRIRERESPVKGVS
jgi:putative ABC transport system ATP-binding protein